MKYVVFVTIKNVQYATQIAADSDAAAEHFFLDQAYCGRHNYGVDGCMAYGPEAMKTDSFIGQLLNSEMATPDQVNALIERRNLEIIAEEKAERAKAKIKEIDAQIAKLLEEKEKAQRDLCA